MVVQMRLKKEQIDLIVKTVKFFIEDASIYLFGSRVDDSKRGGDIDIFLSTEQEVLLRDKIAILAQLERNGIDRKVDMVIRTPKHTHDKLYNEVMTKGISIC